MGQAEVGQAKVGQAKGKGEDDVEMIRGVFTVFEVKAGETGEGHISRNKGFGDGPRSREKRQRLQQGPCSGLFAGKQIKRIPASFRESWPTDEAWLFKVGSNRGAPSRVIRCRSHRTAFSGQILSESGRTCM